MEENLVQSLDCVLNIKILLMHFLVSDDVRMEVDHQISLDQEDFGSSMVAISVYFIIKDLLRGGDLLFFNYVISYNSLDLAS